MADLGFWALAQAEPGHLALVTPEGGEVAAGDLLAGCNRLVHGLRALGVEQGDAVAAVLPNCRELIELYLACLQAGWYLVPINHHLVSPEIAHIAGDSEARVLVAHERFADAARAAATELGFPPEASFSVGRIAGFRSWGQLVDGQPDDLPEGRTLGAVMNYTSGTTGSPKGVRRPLPGLAPEAGAISLGGMLLMFGLQPDDGNVHLVGSPLGAPCTWVTPSCSWTDGRRRACWSSSSGTGSPAATWCRPSSTGCWRCPPRSAPATTCRRCVTWCTRPRHARPTSSVA